MALESNKHTHKFENSLRKLEVEIVSVDSWA